MGLQPTRVGKKKRKRKRPPKKLVGSQARMDTGQSIRQTESLERCRKQIEELRWMVEVVKGYVKDEPNPDVMFTAMALERYGNSKLTDAWWWLHTELHLMEDFEDWPNIDNYEIGSYWDGHSEGTEQFVRDRAKRALSLLERELEGAEETLGGLESRSW